MKTVIIIIAAVILGVWNCIAPLNAQINWQQATLPTSETLRSIVMQDSVAVGNGKSSLFRSENYGKTWARLGDSTLPLKTRSSSGILDVQLYAAQYQLRKIFFLFDDVPYRSIDMGRSWQIISSLPEQISYFTTVGQSFLALAPNGVLYKSDDGGIQWSKVQTSGIPSLNRIAGFFYNGKALFLLFSPTPYRATSSFLRSLDTGKTWTNIGWNNAEILNGVITQGDTLWTITHSKTDSIFRSIDNGISWQLTRQGLQSTSASSLITHRSKVYISTGNGGFVFAPSNNSWQPIPNQPTNDYFSFTNLTNSSALFVIGKQMLRSEDEGRTWTTASQGLYPQTLFPITSTSIGLFAQEAPLFAPENAEYANFGLVFFSQDKGQSWQTTNTGIIGRNGIVQTKTSLWSSPYGVLLNKSNFNVSPLNFLQAENVPAVDVLTGNENALFLNAYGALIESRDEGITFRSNSLTGSPYAYGFPPPVLNELFLQGSTVYAVTNQGIFLSRDVGKTWIQTAPAQNFQNRAVRPTVLINGNIVFATVNPQRVLVITSATSTLGNGYVLSPDFYRSLDSGKTWERLNLPDSSGVHAIVNIGNTVFAASTSNIYQSTSEGKTWQRISQGLPQGKITTLANDSKTLYACIFGQGLFKAAISTVGIQHEQTEIFRSSPAPNPSTDYADLAFTLPRAAQAAVTLYSTLGTEVWRSESGTFPAGEQHIRIDTRHLPTGVYAYRLVVDGMSSVGRVVVVR